MTDITSQPVPTFPLPRPCPYSPPPEYQQLRENTPIARVRLASGACAWAVTRHEDVRAVLADPRFSSDRAHPGFPLLIPDTRTTLDFRRSLISLDPPEHGPARRAVLGEFTVKRIQALAPRIQQIVDECLDTLLATARPADLVQALSLPVPSLVICELLGVPYADHAFFQNRSSRLLRRTTPRHARRTAVDELRSYLDDLVTEKEAQPGDDLLGRQVRKQRENGAPDHEGLVSLAFLLLVAGHETTANMISLGTLALLENPQCLAAIRADPGKTPGAVEELLRCFTIVEFATSRVAVQDVELGGVHIRAGDGVLGLSNAANHDPEAFDNPGHLDIERGARHHMAFGYGPHQCLGQNLARTELQIVFDTLFRRIPTLALAAPVEELPFKDDANIHGLYELPVTW